MLKSWFCGLAMFLVIIVNGGIGGFLSTVYMQNLFSF